MHALATGATIQNGALDDVGTAGRRNSPPIAHVNSAAKNKAPSNANPQAPGADAWVPASSGMPSTVRRTLLEYRAILENASVGIAFTRESRFQQANPRFEAMFGWEFGTLVGEPGGVVWCSDDDYAEIGRTVGPLLAQGLAVELERPMRRRDGTVFVAHVRAKAIDPALPSAGGTIWIIEDVSEHKRVLRALEQARDELELRVRDRTIELADANARLSAEIDEREQAERCIRHLAQHDALTDLPNRRLLEERLHQAIEEARACEEIACVMFVDLDRFKVINDSLGHSVGDRVLKAVAERLVQCLRPQDTVSRMGGDEFVLVVPRIGSADGAAEIANRLIETISTPFSIDGQVVRVTPSVGISLYPRDGDSVQALLGSADAAMYRAKSIGRRTLQFYTSELRGFSPERLRLENDLYGALERGELLLHYQPRFDLREGTLSAGEALLRWRHPKRGLLRSTDFIALAEDTGLIAPIGAWVLRQACEQNRRWQDAGLRIVPIAVNLSARQFRADGHLDKVAAMLGSIGLEPRMLELEVTESVLMQHRQDALATLAMLSDMGVRISIDDFGTGYSSLAYLKRLPVDLLKIDPSFVRDVATDADDAVIVQAIIGLARNLRFRVVAEGVETAEQKAFLDRAGCDEAQGTLFGEPMPAEQFERVLRSGIRTPALRTD
jgi:diguanylate cyclase (GGDEF)-like protein/PAS domain S-box-containing protein